ncbi:MAG: restriction endonuclease subunit S [Odoribacter sp.]|nr:restriction endonuclease subunit S [Odoribacter sp.]
MRAMKDSGIPWIGEIPVHWEVKRLKQESTFINGFAFDSGDFKIEDGVRVIRIGDIGLKADFEHCVRAITNPQLLAPYKIKNGDILIAMSGATTGKCCIVDNAEEAYINQRVGIIRSDIRKIIYYSLQTQYFMEFVKLNNAGSAQPNISFKAIGDFSILSMPTTEQQRIAEFLDRKCAEVDEMIALQEQIIEELKAYKQSVITEAVTKGLNPAAPMRDSGIEWIGSIPEHWEVCRMKNVCTQNPNSLSEKEDKELEFDYVDIGSVSFEKGIFKSEHYAFKDAPSRARRKASLGDLIMSTVRTYLRAIDIVNTEEKANYIYSTGFAVLTPFDNIKYQYLSYISKSQYFLEQVGILSKGINYPSINSTDLMTISIALPTLTEQQAIADYLDKKCADIDSLIQTKQSKIDSLKEYKKSIIYEYVTGKREVE